MLITVLSTGSGASTRMSSSALLDFRMLSGNSTRSTADTCPTQTRTCGTHCQISLGKSHDRLHYPIHQSPRPLLPRGDRSRGGVLLLPPFPGTPFTTGV